MANIKSQIKRDKTNIKSAEKNQILKTKVKGLSKKFKQTVDAKDNDGAKVVMSAYFKALDKAAKANTVKDNFAANKKSKAAKYLNKAQAVKPEPDMAQEAKSDIKAEVKAVKTEKAKAVKTEKAKPAKTTKAK